MNRREMFKALLGLPLLAVMPRQRVWTFEPLGKGPCFGRLADIPTWGQSCIEYALEVNGLVDEALAEVGAAAHGPGVDHTDASNA